MRSPIYKSRQIFFDFQCYEDIHAMPEKNGGRHCSSCDKILIDFRKWKEEDLRNFLNKNKSEHVCGFFSPGQVVSDALVKPILPQRNSLFRPAQIALLAMAALVTGCADEPIPNSNETEKEEESLNEKKEDTSQVKHKEKNEVKDTTLHQTAKGKLDVCVVSTSNNPRTYVTAGIPAPEIVEAPDLVIPPPEETFETSREVLAYVEESAEFPGGVQAMYDFIARNLSYPEKAREAHIEGKVYVQLIVEANGEISETKILRGVDPSLDNAAIYVIKLMPDWKPGKIKGKAVASKFVLPINFRLQ